MEAPTIRPIERARSQLTTANSLSTTEDSAIYHLNTFNEISYINAMVNFSEELGLY
jgi:hypothetical protein